MELASIEREVFGAAPPAVVFEVVSRSEHIREWWSDEATYDVTAGATGEIWFGDPTAGGSVQPLTGVAVRAQRIPCEVPS